MVDHHPAGIRRSIEISLREEYCSGIMPIGRLPSDEARQAFPRHAANLVKRTWQ